MENNPTVHPLTALNPYLHNWTIKVRVTSKGNIRNYKNARGEGLVFSVELTDHDGTQIQATMFNETARRLYDVFQLGKIYFLSRGIIKIANRQFTTVDNDYEITLNQKSVIDEANEEDHLLPEIKFNFVPIDQLDTYVNKKELVDVIGVVQKVSQNLSIRRKQDNEKKIPKRDITIADNSKKTVVISLWNDLATNIGKELLDLVDTNPIVALKYLKVGQFNGVTLSTLGKSTIMINPNLPLAKALKSWYDSEDNGVSMDSITTNDTISMYSNRVFISHIVNNPSMGDDKPEFLCLNAQVSYINPDQPMWYQACKQCNKKVTESLGSGYWCGECQKNYGEYNLRYIVRLKICDPTGEATVSLFNKQAVKVIGCTAEELDTIKKSGGEILFQQKLNEATWTTHLFGVSVTQKTYNNDKRQNISTTSVAPIDFVAGSKILLEEINKMQESS